jgi:RHS repeat-associated protein
VTYNAATNPISGEAADANGNVGAGVGGSYTYDVENRIVGSIGNSQSAYAPGNKRVWRGVWISGTLSTDEVTVWNVQKLPTYSIAETAYYTQGGLTYQPTMMLTQTGTDYYFGGKLIKNSSGYIGQDSLGSIGKFYPYGLEKPSATTNGTEKFTGYMRDAETGLDYANNRYHSPGQGRFISVDRKGGDPSDPGSWNRYAYTRGDPSTALITMAQTPAQETTSWGCQTVA